MRDTRARPANVAAVVACMLTIGAAGVGQREHGPAAKAIGIVRAVTSAQSGHAARFGRYAASLDDLAIPPDIASAGERFGYRFELVPGSHPARRYAYVAFPVRGHASPAFCADASALIYVSPGGARPLVRDGRCVDRRSRLQ